MTSAATGPASAEAAAIDGNRANDHVHSYYAATANPAPKRVALQGAIETDVCVVGAGYTGLSAAIHLAERGYRVVLLEGARVGWGASGRNGGQIVNGYSRDLDNIRGRYGEEAAHALGDMSLEGGRIIRELVEKYAIDCDLKKGSLYAALSARQMRELERQKRTWESYGHDGLQIVPRAELAEHVNSERYVGGMLDHYGGHMHPLNLALGEARALEKRGGVVYEFSRVTRLDRGDKPVAHTEYGCVAARFVVLCGNAYLGGAVPELSREIMPVSTQVLATEPLAPEVARALIPSDVCVEDCNFVLDYFRLTADRRLLYGGGVVYGGKDPRSIVAKIRPSMLKTFPSLERVKIDFAWSGNFALTLSRIPHFGRLSNTIYFMHGYSGHGIATSHLAGRLVAEAIDGQATRFDAFAKLPFAPFPGGQHFRVPLTVLGSWYYRLRDQLGI